MDNSWLFPKLFELQKLISRKADLASKVANVHARERSYQLELDLKRAIHLAVGANARFNEQGMLDFMQEQRGRDEETKSQYRELCKQIEALEAEIDSEIIATAL